MNKKMKSVIVVFIFVFIIISTFVIFGIIDYNRFLDDKTPIFIVEKTIMNDGGTTIYYGIGYQMIDWKIIDGTEITTIQYKIGKEVNFFRYIDPIYDGPNVELKILKEENIDSEISE